MEQELTRLGKMEKSTDAIRKQTNNIDHEIGVARKSLDLLLRKAQSTLRALQVELHEESEERKSPIGLPADSLEQGSQALVGDHDASAA